MLKIGGAAVQRLTTWATRHPEFVQLSICGVSKKFSEWYQKTNKTEDKTN
jgi:hypothetical protein